MKTNTKKRVTEDRFDGPKRCPSCGQLSFRESVFRRHVERCCPDLLPSTSYNSIFEEEEKLEEWLKTAREKELSLHQKAVCEVSCLALRVFLWFIVYHILQLVI